MHNMRLRLSKPSLSTVAEAAGVSPSTVSNAYNRPEHLSAEVRARVFAIAAEQGYAGPDPAARSLRSRRAGAVGVLFTMQLSYAFSDPYCAEMLRGLTEIAEAERVGVLLMPLVPHAAALGEEEARESVQAVRRAVIDGAVADGIADDHPALEVLMRRGLPLVRSVDHPDARCVLIDDRAAGRRLAEHVASLGHRRIAVVVDGPGPPGQVTPASERALFPYAQLRLEGLRQGSLPYGCSTAVVSAGVNAVECGRRAAHTLLDSGDPPSAMLAVTDVLAFGVLDALAERGLVPGRDVSVTGFDDVPAAVAAGLTTVRQPIREKGRLMGRMLLDSTFNERRVVLPAELICRASTGHVGSE
jgi:DNA-binding LacI/PurR family transcriptional regulator